MCVLLVFFIGAWMSQELFEYFVLSCQAEADVASQHADVLAKHHELKS